MGGCCSTKSVESENSDESSSNDSIGEELKDMRTVGAHRDTVMDRELQEIVDDLAANVNELRERNEGKRKKRRSEKKKRRLTKIKGLWEEGEEGSHPERDMDRDNDEDRLIKDKETTPEPTPHQPPSPKEDKVHLVLDKMLSSQLRKYKERLLKPKKSKKSKDKNKNSK